MALNSKQQEFFDRVIQDQDQAKFVLLGSAGTGKTFTISTIANYFIENKKDVVCLAPTHCAKHVLASNFSPEAKASGHISFMTIDKALKKRPITNDFRETYFIGQQDLSDLQADLLIVDEMSMISLQKVQAIKAFKGTIIFTGDFNQLPPVMAKANDLSSDDEVETFVLTEQMRNSSAIEVIANRARDLPIPYYPASDIKSADELLDKFLQDDLENSIYLCFTNARANYVSAEARKRIYGTNVLPFVSGEKLLSRFNSATINRNETFIIKSAELIDEQNQDWRLELETGEFILTKPPEAMAKFKEFLEDQKQKAIYWREKGELDEYANIIDEVFSELDKYKEVLYPYARTIHKSQGSTFKNVYVEASEIDEKGSNKKKLLFVAYSRASENLYTIKVSANRKQIIDMIINSVKSRYGAAIPKRRDRASWSKEKILGHINWHIEDSNQSLDFSQTELDLATLL